MASSARDLLAGLDAWRQMDRPMLYLQHIRARYSKRAREQPSEDDYLVALAEAPGWTRCNEFRRLTLLHYCDVARCALPLDRFSTMVREMLDWADRCKVEPGTAVGIQAAQSICERTSQMLLNTFHLAGTRKSASGGISRLKELVDATMVPTICTWGPLRGPAAADAVERMRARSMRDLSSAFGIVEAAAQGQFEIFFTLRDAADWGRHVRTSRHLPKGLRATMHWNGQDVRFRVSRHGRGYANQRMREIADAHVGGLAGVREVEVDDAGDAWAVQERPAKAASAVTWQDLEEALPGLDLRIVQTSNLQFVQDNLGVEAARAYLLQEITRVLAAEGIEVSARHIMVLVDNMTHQGGVSAHRYGSIDLAESVILKASFQQATETFAAAAAAGAADLLADVSSQILMGKVAEVGAAATDCLVVPAPVAAPSQPKRKRSASPQPMQPASPEAACAWEDSEVWQPGGAGAEGYAPASPEPAWAPASPPVPAPAPAPAPAFAMPDLEL